MDVEINNVIYMELNSGPKIANSTCGKTIDVETIDRDSTVSAIWNDAKSSGFWSVGIQYAHGWYVVHSKSINKDEDKDKNIFCFTNNISPKFNDLFIG